MKLFRIYTSGWIEVTTENGATGYHGICTYTKQDYVLKIT